MRREEDGTFALTAEAAPDTRYRYRLSGGEAAYRLVGERDLSVRWKLGDGSLLALLANLGPEPLDGFERPPAEPLYASEGASGDGSELPAGGLLRVPRATYRLQFNEGFTFSDAAGLVPYLKARPGSTHGYDVVDHGCLNPELGDEGEYERMVEMLEEHEMGQLLDIVPNHAGIGSDNAGWIDVLENGPASPYARFFDIDWCRRTELCGKVLLPILSGRYRTVLEAGELELVFDAEAGSFSVNYPIDPKTYPMTFDSAGPELQGRLVLSTHLDRDGERVNGGIVLRGDEGVIVEQG